MYSFHSGCHSAATLDCTYPTLDTRSGLSPVQLVDADVDNYSSSANDVIGVSHIKPLTFFYSVPQPICPPFACSLIRPIQRVPARDIPQTGNRHRIESVVTTDHGQCLAIVQSGSAPALPTGKRLTVLLVTALPPAYPPTTGENVTVFVDASRANIFWR